MDKQSRTYQAYVQILKEELIPAMGCTEPIALAYAAAVAGDRLGGYPEVIDVEVSRNIVKNVKSVVVPNTGGLNGIEAAVAAGQRNPCTFTNPTNPTCSSSASRHPVRTKRYP